MKSQPDHQTDIWMALKRAAFPLSVRDLAGSAPVKRQYLHRMIGIWADAGFLFRQQINGMAHYSMRLDAPHRRPLITRDGEIVDREPAMPIWQLFEILHTTGLTRKALVEMIRTRLGTPVKFWELETGQKPLTRHLADTIHQIAREHEKLSRAP